MHSLEKMDDFFTARVDGYDEHMFTNVCGCRQAYRKMARLLPRSCRVLLDLGCGTGLELDEIWKIRPDIAIVGIDLTQAMLDKLREKHPDKQMTCICGDYFTEELGESRFDCAISFQTMHHFSHERKIGLYRKIHRSLKDNGSYIECDYMVESQEEEDFYFAENARIRAEQKIPSDAFYHYDIPCTVTNQINMLRTAGFPFVEKVFRLGNTTILVAGK